MVRFAFWIVLLLGAPAIAKPSWHFVATFPAKQGDPVDVEATLTGQSGLVRLCTRRDGFGRYIHEVKVGDQSVASEPDEPDCWSFHAPKQGPLQIRYRADIAAEAKDSHDP